MLEEPRFLPGIGLLEGRGLGVTLTIPGASLTRARSNQHSVATDAFGHSSVETLARAARIRNADRGITGLLLYGESRFIQLLEGDLAVVDAVLESIRQDGRHRDLTVIEREAILPRLVNGFGEPGCAGHNDSADDRKGESRGCVEPTRATLPCSL